LRRGIAVKIITDMVNKIYMMMKIILKETKIIWKDGSKLWLILLPEMID
jgi:hypothetical protein